MILLFGGTGFLGEHVARRLEGRPAAALVRETSSRGILPPRLPVRVGTLDDLNSIGRALDGVDTVVYCASMGFGHVPGLVRLLERHGVNRAVFTSTTAIYTTLEAPSRAARLAAEDGVTQSRLSWTILRPTMIYGTARDRNIARLLRLLRRAPVYPVVAGGRALQQPIYVEDLADAVVRTLDAPGTIGRSYNLAGAAPLPYKDLVQTAARAMGRSVRLVDVPSEIVLGAIGLASWLRLPTIITAEQVRRLAENKAFDYAEAVRDFGFQARTFAEGVKLEAAALGFAPLASRGERVWQGPRVS